MAYEVMATQKTPALIIYLLDTSGSMAQTLDGASKISHVNKAFERVLIRMVRRSTRGELVSPRYRLAIIAYSNQAVDLVPGIETIDKIAKRGRPELTAQDYTNTAKAFELAHKMLKAELPNLAGHPAPMVCHMTDGEFTGADPEPIVREIMEMSTGDGNVLVENIFIGQNLTKQPIDNAQKWPGVLSVDELTDPHVTKLYNMSSPLPVSYSQAIREDGYAMQPGARMLFPAATQELIELAFAMSGATPTA
jgi:uncharacterized protein YegL